MTEAAENKADARAGGRPGARQAAAQAVYQCLVADTDAGDLIRQFRAGGCLSGCDVEYFDLVVRSVLEDRPGLEAAFTSHLDRGLEQLDPVEHAILLLGAFELRDRVEIPRGVVINEALELAKRFGAEGGHRYINGVLDGIARDLRPSEAGRPARG